ncbi:MAG: hypothetical protein JWQ90_4901 [Hydrocarboniphaga sp.]|nr:hypothetical protein [Hydrocarboniphaga sp.]
MSSPDWASIHASYVRAIQQIDFPVGAGTLTLRKKVKRPDGQSERNGVGYLRRRFLKFIVEVEGWESEADVDLARDRRQPDIRLYPSLETYQEPITSNFGDFDLVTTAAGGTRVAIEWETGNISSSHRSLNKLAIALASGKIQVGVLIVPSRQTYVHLTDRIGNIGELSAYLELWESLKVSVPRGLLAISVVEHDELTDSDTFPYLPSGKDGRAKQGRSKRKRAKRK